MSDEQEIDFGQEEDNESGLHDQPPKSNPPWGSPEWRARMRKAQDELREMEPETKAVVKAMIWAIDKIFGKPF